MHPFRDFSRHQLFCYFFLVQPNTTSNEIYIRREPPVCVLNTLVIAMSSTLNFFEPLRGQARREKTGSLQVANSMRLVVLNVSLYVLVIQVST
jgi:hypothetical protein